MTQSTGNHHCQLVERVYLSLSDKADAMFRRAGISGTDIEDQRQKESLKLLSRHIILMSKLSKDSAYTPAKPGRLIAERK